MATKRAVPAVGALAGIGTCHSFELGMQFSGGAHVSADDAASHSIVDFLLLCRHLFTGLVGCLENIP